MRIFKRIFFWLSGAGSETLEQCPNWEQRKYVAFGATVLVPSAFAFIACAYALSTISDDPRVIFSVAAVWSFIILTIDRALLAGYRPYLSFTRKVSQFSLRMVVAILMGVTIAHPLVLLLFRDTITSVIEADRAAEIEIVRSKFDEEKDKVRSQMERVEANIASNQQKYNETHQAKFIFAADDDQQVISGLSEEQQKELKAAVAEAVAPYNTRLEAIGEQEAELTPQYTRVQTELGYWQKEFEMELNGQRSGLAGEGPRARSIRSDQLEPRREEAKRLGGLLEHLSAERTMLQTQAREAEKATIEQFELKLAALEEERKIEEKRIAELRKQVQENQAEQFVTQQNALRDTIKAQIDSLLVELKRVQGELAGLASEESARLTAMREEPRRDILTQTLALHRLFKAGDEGGKFAFYTYIVLTMLFMLVDTIPLIVKFFTKPGPYDTLVDRDEVTFDSNHKVFHESNRRYMEQFAAGGLTTAVRNPRLETAMINGMEHSRAAREFIASLIEMEKTFAEKMKEEEAAIGSMDVDSRQTLQAMKERFYKDLHHQMETFFTTDKSATSQ